MRILIVEDEPLTALLADATLSGAGHEILGPVSSARDALREAQHIRPDLLLTDIDLMDHTPGTDLARTMRDRWGVRCLFMSAQPTLARLSGAWALGILHKPYSPLALERAVEIAGLLMRGEPAQEGPLELEIFAC